MSDQCERCTSRGDLTLCAGTYCGYHDSWYALTLVAKLEKAEETIDFLRGQNEDLVKLRVGA